MPQKRPMQKKYDDSIGHRVSSLPKWKKLARNTITVKPMRHTSRAIRDQPPSTEEQAQSGGMEART
eukprot:CAMPEP_0206489330 /NCGR_PEP_ID=MMETSP0324_2-20121206/43155_1 /ASSEMBLY_ACC=CAM_ASM_000836 /TAXON_ID=2866 /ORGANISM="Crypthecodinium cohnii, Strain Seligo" /LENGTH=65 /DNA_ID=CAMNT_0053968947 /DNA_START=167 /DNA_END=360 /DNA_ORIENTATION=+